MSLETGVGEIDAVYYLIQARVDGIANAKEELSKFASFLEGHPLAVAGAFGAALVAIGVKAVATAAQTDLALRQIGSSIPGLKAQVTALGGAIDQLARTTGTSFQQLLEASHAIGYQGVSGLRDLTDRLATINKISTVTGEDMGGLATTLGRVAREFHLNGDAADLMARRLVALSAGKTTVTEMAAAVSQAAPSVLKLGLSFDTTAAAIAALVGGGEKARQAGAQISEFAQQGDEGRRAIEALGSGAHVTADQIGELDRQFTAIQQSPAQAAKVIREDFMSALRDLATGVLRNATSGIHLLANEIDTLTFIMTDGHSETERFAAGLTKITIPDGATQLQDFLKRTNAALKDEVQTYGELNAKLRSPVGRALALTPLGGPVQASDQAARALAAAQIQQYTQAIADAQAKLHALGSGAKGALDPVVDGFVKIADHAVEAAGDSKKLLAILQAVDPKRLSDAIAAAGSSGNVTALIKLQGLFTTLRSHIGDISTATQTVADDLKQLQDRATEAAAALQGDYASSVAKLNTELGALRQKLKDDGASPGTLKAADTLIASIKGSTASLHAQTTAMQNAKTVQDALTGAAVSYAQATGDTVAAQKLQIEQAEQVADDQDRELVRQGKLSQGAALLAAALRSLDTFTQESALDAGQALAFQQQLDDAILATKQAQVEAGGQRHAAVLQLIEDERQLYNKRIGQTKDLSTEQQTALIDQNNAAATSKITAEKTRQLHLQQQIAQAWVGIVQSSAQLLVNLGAISESVGQGINAIAQLGGSIASLLKTQADPTHSALDTLSAVGGVVGTAAGVVSVIESVVTSIFDSGRQAREAAAQFKLTEQSWAETLRAFVDSTSATVSDLQKQLDAAQSNAQSLRHQAAQAFGVKADQEVGLESRTPQQLRDFLAVRQRVLDFLGESSATDAMSEFARALLAIGPAADAATAKIRQDFIQGIEDAFTASGPGGQNLLTLQGYQRQRDATLASITAGGFDDTTTTTLTRDALGTFTHQWHAFIDGLSLDDLTALLPSLTGDERAYAAALEHSKRQAANAAAAADAFASTLQRITDGFAVFGIDAIGQAQSYLTALAASSDQLQQVFAGIDLSTADGLNAADVALQAFYGAIESGAVTFDSTTVSWQQFLAAAGYLNSALQEETERAQQAADAARQLAETNTDAARALAQRAAQDRGDSLGVKQLQDQAEYAADAAAGWDAANLAQLAYLEGQEELSLAQQAAADQAQQAAQAQADAAQRAADAAQRAAQATQALIDAQHAQAQAATQQLQQQFQLFGITDPVQQAKEMVGVLREIAPVFRTLVGNQDVGTASGRAGILGNLQTFFLQNPAGQASGLSSADEVSQQVLDLAQLLQSAGVSTTTTGGSNSSFAVDNTITTADANRMSGLLDAILTTANEQLDALRVIAGAFAPAIALSGPPALPSATGPAPSGTMIIQLTFNGQSLDPNATLTASSQATARALGWQIVQEVRRTQAGSA